jgi:hypothetical protein
MIQPEIESVEIGEPLIYVDRKTGLRCRAMVLEANALTGRVRVRVEWCAWEGRGPARRYIEKTKEFDTSTEQLFRVGGKRRVQ